MAVAHGYPSKNFFINMLTRDIDLNDAILDLLDNCIDGVVRQKGKQNKSNQKDFYKGFSAKILIEPDSFTIEDNCGGIPYEDAQNYAFMMGNDNVDTTLPTVGVYGIGMKRAIFKIGTEAIVMSKTREKSFQVIIPAVWNKTTSWDFDLKELDLSYQMEHFGTKIVITNLNEQIKSIWAAIKLDNFIDDLIRAIKHSYSLIIQKGFEIRVNGISVENKPIELIFSKDNTGIRPYFYKKNFGEVEASLVVGFYSPIISQDEIDEGNESKRSSSDAGWTVICNDRVILYNDKSYATGWGEAGVPQYHTQFIGIRGVVTFTSNNAYLLPMTTTKRGIDLSSHIYAEIKNKMRDGLKLFTNYTNKWKGRVVEEKLNYEYITMVNAEDFMDTLKIFNIPLKNSRDESSEFKPELPKPINDHNYIRISFSKPEEAVDILHKYYHDYTNEIPASSIGEKCFDEILKRAQMQIET